MTELKTNVLYFGDNLEILRRYIPDSSIDLIYLDPPFNSPRVKNESYSLRKNKFYVIQNRLSQMWHRG